MEQTVHASKPPQAGLSGRMQTNDSVCHQHKSSFSIYKSDFGRGKTFYITHRYNAYILYVIYIIYKVNGLQRVHSVLFSYIYTRKLTLK